ncbi:hypothetical protein OB03_13645 [Brevundimonas sp. GN22]
MSELYRIFDLETKASLEAHLKVNTVLSHDFANLIWACQSAFVPLGHLPIHRNLTPSQLSLSSENLEALAQNGVGPLQPAAKKTANKIMATFKERKLFNAHYFWRVDRPQEWHLFYFTQRDISGEHWDEGSHIHLINWLTHPTLDIVPLLERVISEPKVPSLPSGIHVRYVR